LAIIQSPQVCFLTSSSILRCLRKGGSWPGHDATTVSVRLVPSSCTDGCTPPFATVTIANARSSCTASSGTTSACGGVLGSMRLLSTSTDAEEPIATTFACSSTFK